MRFKKLRAFFSRIRFYKIIRSIYEAIAGFILRRTNLNKAGRDGETPLYKAVFKEGNYKKVARLIKNGADINAIDTDGDTLLLRAARIQRREAMDLLIKNGADVNATNNKSGGTPLHIAVRVENLEIMDLFIKNGANVNAADRSRDGDTALHILAERSRWHSEWSYINGAMRLLIKNGARITKINKIGKTPLDVAVLMYMHESRNKKTSVSIILMLMVCLLLQNRHTKELSSIYIYRVPILGLLWYACKVEINALSKLTVSIKSLGTLSLIDVLKEEDENKLALIFKNKEVKKIVENLNLKERYPQVEEEIRYCLLIKQKKGLARHQALETARKSIFNCNENRQLNEDCWREILKNLPQEDLKNVTKVASLFFKNGVSNDTHNFGAMDARDNAQMAFNH